MFICVSMLCKLHFNVSTDSLTLYYTEIYHVVCIERFLFLSSSFRSLFSLPLHISLHNKPAVLLLCTNWLPQAPVTGFFLPVSPRSAFLENMHALLFLRLCPQKSNILWCLSKQAAANANLLFGGKNLSNLF